MQPLIELSHVWAGYDGAAVLHDASFKICAGDYIGVIGPNGGGKTTLLKVVLGLLKPIQGTVKRAEGLQIGYLPQSSTLDRKFPASVREVVLMGRSRVWQSPSKADQERAEGLLAQMGVEQLAHRAVGELSGGELQRTLLARALMCRPQLLVLDEPTTYVDQQFNRAFYDLLAELNHTTAILMASHDLGTISQHVGSIACVNRSLHFHPSSQITPEQLAAYHCPIQILEHGAVPHTVLEKHT